MHSQDLGQLNAPFLHFEMSFVYPEKLSLVVAAAVDDALGCLVLVTIELGFAIKVFRSIAIPGCVAPDLPE